MHWLEKELRSLAFDENHHLGMGDIRITQGMLNDLFNRGKEMEREQIKKAVTYTIEAEYYRQTWDNCASVGACADDYYNETYGNPDQV